MSRLTVLSILLTVLLVSVYSQSANSRVKIVNNGYSEIVVAFHNRISEAEGYPLIQKLKELFSSASHGLFRATRKRSYFKQVTILVPKTWSKKPEYQTASYEVFTEADLIIDEENPLYGDGPYTQQPTPCGQPARHIHITPNYLKHLNTTSTEMFGDPGKTLVHEWAHFRYGIFDEYPEAGIDDFPAFYIDQRTEEVLPNACANAELVGEEWNPVKSRSCTRQRNGLPEDDCQFLPDPTKNDKVTSSIASYHFLPNSYTFCDESDEFKHNSRAPNRHNLLCSARSTWNVITSHNDFAKNKNPPKEIADTTPEFKIVQQEEATFCLVLDISSSMNDPQGYTKIAMLRDAASRWIQEEVKTGSNVGVVLFGHGAQLAQSIIPVNNNNDRALLISKIPPTAGGMTCIGCGLNEAMKELNRFRKGSPGGIIVLLSDGGENEAPMIADVQQNVINAKIRVVTMAFTAAASPNMEALAAATGGKQFSIPLDQSVGKLESSFQEIGTYQTTDDDLAAKIDEQRFKGLSTAFEGTFSIDDTIGRHTVISFLYTDRNDILDITISRSGWSVTSPPAISAGGKFEDITLRKQIKFTFDNLPTETYNYKVNRRGSTNQDVTVSISSKSRVKGKEAIRTTCKIEEVVGKTPPQYLITADVQKGMKPVINGEVTAKVDLPNGKFILIQLLDNGKRGDVLRDDGIYSAYFTKYIGIGRYAVSASVVSTTETTFLETGYTASKALPILNKQSRPANVTKVKTGNFKRVADAGSIQIQQNINAQATDLFPPSRISDLKIVEIADDNSYVALEWTAPGDDLQDGQAAQYEMKYTMNWEELNGKFSGQDYNITDRPKPAGETEKLKAYVRGLGDGVTYYIAVKTKDKENKWSELSNIAEVRGNKVYYY